ncbi:MAG TPA: alkaline phosphatase family protein [Vicinamibacteria bacterium]|nr:alkaline phosphatase family protein [Vicinamibacteria bacterium]
MASPRGPLSSVDEVRDELRRLGYLEHGLDRFVLSGAVSSGPARASARAATRIGLLGGLLFGITLTVAASLLDPRLRGEPRDLVVLALYLVGTLALVTGAATFLAGLAAGWWARRRRRRPGATVSRNVGLAVGVMGLGYVALWWRSHAWSAPLPVQVLAALLGLALCLALGRFGALAAVAVLTAGGMGDHLPEASLSRRRMLPLLGVAALLLGGAVSAAAYLSGAPAAAPDFAVVPTGLRIRVLGVDGLDRDMAEQMIGRGEMPHLQDLLAGGAQATLRVEREQVPAIVWTTVATGRGPEAHGIRSTGARRLPGMRMPVPEDDPFARALGAATDLLRLGRAQPATSVLRGAKTFWNVASEKGLRVGVVNWWATWPADPVNGYVVTERALFKLEKGGAFDRETFPPEAFERLRPLAASVAEKPRGIDTFALEAARALRTGSPPDVEAVYLPGLDIATMQLLGDGAATDLASLDARLHAVRAYYRFVDGVIGQFGAEVGEDDVFVLVGDPGRLARRSGRAEGLLVLRGGPVGRRSLGSASERDVAPTVLHLAGLPVSAELEGVALEAALEEGFRAAHPVRRVDSYGRRPTRPPAESAFDREMLEELRSLGYVQ